MTRSLTATRPALAATLALAGLAAALLLLTSSARAAAGSVTWLSPTPTNHTSFTATVVH